MNVPEGWKLVPIEPTKEMDKAAYFAEKTRGVRSYSDLYRAMLAASPEPPATQPNVRDAGPTPFAGRAAGTRREALNSDATWPHEVGP